MSLSPETNAESETHAASLEGEVFQRGQCVLVTSSKQALVAYVFVREAGVIGTCEPIAVKVLPGVAVGAANLGTELVQNDHRGRHITHRLSTLFLQMPALAQNDLGVLLLSFTGLRQLECSLTKFCFGSSELVDDLWQQKHLLLGCGLCRRRRWRLHRPLRLSIALLAKKIRKRATMLGQRQRHTCVNLSGSRKPWRALFMRGTLLVWVSPFSETVAEESAAFFAGCVGAGVAMTPRSIVPDSLGTWVKFSSSGSVAVWTSGSLETTSVYSSFVGIRVDCMMPAIPSRMG